MKTLLSFAVSALLVACQTQINKQIKQMPIHELHKANLVEITHFQLRDSSQREAFLLKAQHLSDSFLSCQPGFLHRTLTYSDDFTWADIVYWTDEAALEQALQRAATNPAALAFFSFLNEATIQMARYRPVALGHVGASSSAR
ncbi:MAG TPA: hypothetical protein DCE81_12570 [Cytophagales bacterium]|nr:hypothetical protein [Cytophagales bacterium]